MTAVPTDARFTAAQLAALERIEAAEYAPEALSQRVADVATDHMPIETGYGYDCDCGWRRRQDGLTWSEHLADSVLAVLRPADVDGAR